MSHFAIIPQMPWLPEQEHFLTNEKDPLGRLAFNPLQITLDVSQALLRMEL